MEIDVTVNTQPINITATVCPAININAIASSYNIEASVLGFQGQGGQISSGLFYPITNPSGYVSSGETGIFLNSQSFVFTKTILGSGINSAWIPFGVVLSNIPSNIVCSLQNDIDGFIYNLCIFGVNTSGFNVGFSDNLGNSGYILNSQIKV